MGAWGTFKISLYSLALNARKLKRVPMTKDLDNEPVAPRRVRVTQIRGAGPAHLRLGGAVALDPDARSRMRPRLAADGGIAGGAPPPRFWDLVGIEAPHEAEEH